MSRPRSTFIIMAAVSAALAGCGRPDTAGETGSTDQDVPPGVEVTAAPGVAFRYDYAFRLPAQRIAAAQERHADACERLGPDRCRITGMRYLRSPKNDVTADLQFSIVPALARSFGRDAIGVVERSEGGVRSVNVSGEDVGATIDAARTARNATIVERATVEKRIADGNRSTAVELERQRADLGRTIRDVDAQTAGQLALLNATAVAFHYESGKAAPGFETQSPLAQAGELLGWSAGVTFSTLLNLLGLLLPPMLLAAIIAGLFVAGRRFVRRRIAPAA
ncbi:hypothetical protein ASE73_06820 [Sphingomonas sp. Leaf24]|uniref:hypothetical protein n=1 Tax=unclassified Sphingomonas TaxID=196159 RepID=UPI0006FC3F28|nr:MULTISPECIES: hypothetical protein [unclassified Sphingomonas]KQM89311.1 hypothetical protein ASE73_06820 [Sphingomonas sp. Leaf24]